MKFRIEYAILPDRAIHTEYLQAEDKETVKRLFQWKQPNAHIRKIERAVPTEEEIKSLAMDTYNDFFYTQLRDYGFHFGDDVGEPLSTFGYAHGWMACFIKFHIPEERQHIFFRFLEEADDDQFRAVVRRFVNEDWGRERKK